jgi:hypothetical protein
LITVVNVDFSTVLPGGAAAPRIAIADIFELKGRAGDQVPVRQGLIVNLRRSDPVRVDVPPGMYLVRLKAPSGQLLMQRVQVNDDGAAPSLELRPAPSQHALQVDEFGHRVEFGARVPREVAPPRGPSDEPSGSRLQWSARLLDQTGKAPDLTYLPGLPVREVVQERQDYMGVAKLMAQPAADALQSLQRRREGSSHLVGDVSAVQAARLYGDGDELTTQWKYPLRKKAIIGEPSTEGKQRRFFALSYRATDTFSPLQVACIPGRWVTQENELAQVRVSYRERTVGGEISKAMELEVDDPDFGGLIEFLQQGDLAGSYRVVEQALDVLYAKWRNPYAAAAAGYVLLQAGLPGSDVGRNWEQWLLNLAYQYKGIPDGAILFTTLLLQSRQREVRSLRYEGGARNPFRTPLEAALEAVRRGPPLFRYGLNLMATNLAILEAEESNGIQAKEMDVAKRYVRELSLRVDPAQALSVFDVSA